MAGAVALAVMVVVVLPALFLATGAVVCAALGATLTDRPQMLQRDWPKR